MSEQHIPVEFLDPSDEAAMARWAVQLGVTLATLREAVLAIGTDVDKIKIWLTTRPGDKAAHGTSKPARKS